ncbi:hypothetical protein [Flavobacterium pedocola]
MGFEYKIVTRLTAEQVKTIKNIVQNEKTFDKKYECNGQEIWELRKDTNKGKMPNTGIIFEADGIYICQYESPHPFAYLDKLKNYLDNENITYQLSDCQE